MVAQYLHIMPPIFIDSIYDPKARFILIILYNSYLKASKNNKLPNIVIATDTLGPHEGH